MPTFCTQAFDAMGVDEVRDFVTLMVTFVASPSYVRNSYLLASFTRLLRHLVPQATPARPPHMRPPTCAHARERNFGPIARLPFHLPLTLSRRPPPQKPEEGGGTSERLSLVFAAHPLAQQAPRGAPS